MGYTIRMPDALSTRVEQIMERFRKELAALEAKHERMIREIIDKAREKRLAALRKDMTTPH